MARSKQEKKIIDDQIKAYQNMIKFMRAQIKGLRVHRKGGKLDNLQIVVGGPDGRPRMLNKD
jgi:hypothetical protein